MRKIAISLGLLLSANSLIAGNYYNDNTSKNNNNKKIENFNKSKFINKEIKSLKYLLFINNLNDLSFFNKAPINKITDFRLLKFQRVLTVLISAGVGKKIKIDTKYIGLPYKYDNIKMNGERFKFELLDGLKEMKDLVKSYAKLILFSNIEWNKDSNTVKKELSISKDIYSRFAKRIDYEYNYLLDVIRNKSSLMQLLKNSDVMDSYGRIDLNKFFNKILPNLIKSDYSNFNNYVYFQEFSNNGVKTTFYPGGLNIGKNLIRKTLYYYVTDKTVFKNINKNLKYRSFIINDYIDTKHKIGFNSLLALFLKEFYKNNNAIKNINSKYHDYFYSKLYSIIGEITYNSDKVFYINYLTDKRILTVKPYLANRNKILFGFVNKFNYIKSLTIDKDKMNNIELDIKKILK